MRKRVKSEGGNLRTERLLRILGGLAGRYRIVVIGIIAVIAVLFGSDVVRIVGLKRDIARQEHRKSYYEQMIRQDSTILRQLEDNEDLERFAREKYLMRRPGEQIYVVKRQR